MKTFRGDARDNFRSHTAPRESFADAEETSGTRDGRKHSSGIEWFNRPKIDDFDFNPFAVQLILPRRELRGPWRCRSRWSGLSRA